jgi:hypothetical protein
MVIKLDFRKAFDSISWHPSWRSSMQGVSHHSFVHGFRTS